MSESFQEKLLKSYPKSTVHAEEHLCPRSEENGDTSKACWQVDETCSYCGSLHPDVFMERIEAGTVKLEPTDKSYKVYILNDGGDEFKQTFRAAGSPSGNDPSKWEWTTRPTNRCKFYFQHLSEDQKKRFIEKMNDKSLKLEMPGHFYRLPYFCVPAK